MCPANEGCAWLWPKSTPGMRSWLLLSPSQPEVAPPCPLRPVQLPPAFLSPHFLLGFLPSRRSPPFSWIYLEFIAHLWLSAPPLERDEWDEVSRSAPTEAGRFLVFFLGWPHGSCWIPRTPCSFHSEAHVTPSVLTRAELLESFFLKVACERTEKVCECIQGIFSPLFSSPFFSPLLNIKGNFGSCRMKWDYGVAWRPLKMWI